MEEITETKEEIIEVFEIDDDFDPLEDAGLELDDEAEYTGMDYQAPIPDAERSIVPPPVELPPAERIAKLIDGLPGQKFRLLTGIRVCDVPKTLEEASTELEEQFPQGTSVYTAARIIELLTEAGALERIDPEVDEEEAQAEGAGGAAGAAGAGAAGVAAIANTPVAADAPEAQAAPNAGAAAANAPNADDRIDSLSWDDIDLEFDEVEQVEPSTYVATAEGLAAIEERWGTNVAQKVVLDEPQYFPIWKKLLEMCDEPGGQTKKAIEAEIDHDPLLQEPKRYCQYFLEKLKEVNALEWQDAWVTSEIGKEILASDIFAE